MKCPEAYVEGLPSERGRGQENSGREENQRRCLWRVHVQVMLLSSEGCLGQRAVRGSSSLGSQNHRFSLISGQRMLHLVLWSTQSKQAVTGYKSSCVGYFSNDWVCKNLSLAPVSF